MTAEMKFSDGTRNVVLSDLVYGEDWVLSLEKKEGAAKSKKTASYKQESHQSHRREIKK